MTTQHDSSRVRAMPIKVMLALLAALVVAAIALAPHNSAKAQVAPLDQRAVSDETEPNGLPVSYTDAKGHTVFQCLGDALACEIDDPNAPLEEVVYWAGETSMPVGAPDARGRQGEALLVMGVEGSFDAEAGGAPVTGSTILVRARGLEPNTVYKVSHPYGTFKVRTDARGQFPRNAKTLVEHGCDIEVGEECDFAAALENPIFNNFLRPTGTGWNSGADHLSNDTHVATKVVGSLVKNAAGKPQNYFKIEGKNAGGLGKNVKKKAKFSIVGQLVQDLETDPAPPEEEEAE